jgi:hypothetical protein
MTAPIKSQKNLRAQFIYVILIFLWFNFGFSQEKKPIT